MFLVELAVELEVELEVELVDSADLSLASSFLSPLS